VQTGDEVTSIKEGDAIGVLWLGHTCGKCKYCLNNKENLCERAIFTGYTLDGGYAEYTVAYEQFCLKLTDDYNNLAAAPHYDQWLTLRGKME
jgi:alcohol dehydrogenase, propanol-preferring